MLQTRDVTGPRPLPVRPLRVVAHWKAIPQSAKVAGLYRASPKLNSFCLRVAPAALSTHASG